MWDREAREECREHHRELWKERKRELGIGGSTPVEEIPGFLESLERLLEEEEYGVTDVSVMFGLTKERIRQIANEHDMDYPSRGSKYRSWDDARNKFVPVSREKKVEKAAMYDERQKEKERKMIRKKNARRRRGHVLAIREFAEEHGRPPLLEELAEIIPDDIQYTGVARYWGYKKGEDGCSYAEAWDRLYAAAAVGERHGSGPEPGLGLLPREPDTLGARLTKVRLEEGLSQRSVAERIGCHKDTVGDHERGETPPSEDLLERYEELYGVSREWLLHGED